VVVVPERVGGHRPVSIGILTANYVGLLIMASGVDVARRVVGLFDRAVLASLLDDLAEVVDRPGEGVRRLVPPFLCAKGEESRQGHIPSVFIRPDA
jgi:hypothetical protein